MEMIKKGHVSPARLTKEILAHHLWLENAVAELEIEQRPVNLLRGAAHFAGIISLGLSYFFLAIYGKHDEHGGRHEIEPEFLGQALQRGRLPILPLDGILEFLHVARLQLDRPAAQVL